LNLVALQEGVGIAIDSLRANKVRAALTILGIVIGVATVMAMSAMIVGIRTSVTGQLEAFGPDNLFIDRFDQTQLQFSDLSSQRPPWEGKPPITPAEAELLDALPAVQSVTPAVGSSGELRYETQSINSIEIRGRGPLWPDYVKGEFVRGRNFVPSEVQRGALVGVLTETAAEAMFGTADPVGRHVRLRGERFLVIGVHREEPNLFSGLAPPAAVTVPVTTAVQRLGANPDWYSLLVVPRAGVPQDDAIDQITSVMRASRGLRPGEENNFAVIRQEALAQLFNNVTGAFFLIMLVLSSIGLLVGGVGVVAIMMISVTERTREIGVRKALGATPNEILWQFLVESATVTVIGGVIGIAAGGVGAFLIAALTPIPAVVPLWAVAAAIGISAISGIGFGLYPANRAARLDPVEALRYE
jgi:putative ABC transport system permease protein